MKIDLHNYESYLIEYVEGNLDKDESGTLMEWVARNPEKQVELEVYEKTRFIPDETIAMDGWEHMIKPGTGQTFLKLNRYVWILNSLLVATIIGYLFLGGKSVEQPSLLASAVTSEPAERSLTSTMLNPVVAKGKESLKKPSLTEPAKQANHLLASAAPGKVVADPAPVHLTQKLSIIQPEKLNARAIRQPEIIGQPGEVEVEVVVKRDKKLRIKRQNKRVSYKVKKRHESRPTLGPMQQMMVMDLIYKQPKPFDEFYRFLKDYDPWFQSMTRHELKRFLKGNRLYEELPVKLKKKDRPKDNYQKAGQEPKIPAIGEIRQQEPATRRADAPEPSQH